MDHCLSQWFPTGGNLFYKWALKPTGEVWVQIFEFNFLFHHFSWMLCSLEACLNQDIGVLCFLAETKRILFFKS